MKKLISILLVATLSAALCFSMVGCSDVPREELLKIYLPGEYMDEDIFEEFESWYAGETGEKVKVVADKFESVENVQLAVESAQADYDLLCPSDYMIEYLISKNLVKPLNKSIIDVKEEGLFKAEYMESARQFDPENKYAVPYMYARSASFTTLRRRAKR